MQSARERALRRKVRDIWGELLRERQDHGRASRLLRELEEAKEALRRAREEERG